MVQAARWRLVSLLACGVVLLAVVLALCGAPPGGRGRDGGTSGPAGTALGWGFTHTEASADEGEAEARRRAGALLKKTGLPQNQHLMGWGADNPEPAPGRYDFASLDRRVALMRRSTDTPVLTLCCAPDWMKKGGSAGRTDWSELETAPAPEHFDDFAALAGKVARRYPQVRHFLVWNELKGFYDDGAHRWDQEGYTRLYNLVYTELKKVDPGIRVGGPYVVMDSVAEDDHNASDVTGPWGALDRRAVAALRYWNRHRKGADFVVVDGSSYTADDRLVPGAFTATEKLTDVSRWVRRETGLPLWWAEWYVEPGDEDDRRAGWSEARRTAVQAAALIALARGGTDTAFYWNPQTRTRDCPGCLWSSTRFRDGGAELPMMRLLARFAREFPPGTRFAGVRAGSGVRALAAAGGGGGDGDGDGDVATVLVVNTRARHTRTEVAGRTVALDPYEVRWLGTR
ncbi:xylan 1,4-beta-xylosidase [Streptomyces cacaoi]|uniref:xylan 1,4-beta-xylosidase n=1 Tax=Streptomyces cacaoi TaxID=1898 RepID=UPI002624309D|nr:xylan 1,4-beta-xylosidase [Streptomyces cacaoi]